MTALIIFVMGSLLIGAVIFGVIRNHKKQGAPSAGTDTDGTPRNSS